MAARKKLAPAPEQARTTSLLELTSALSQALTPRQVAEAVLRQGIGTVGARMGALFRVDEDSGEITRMAESGRPGNLELFTRTASQAQHPLAEAVRSGKPVFIERERELLARYPILQELVTSGELQSLAALPLRVDGRIIGAIGLCFSTARPVPTVEREYLTALAQLCAQALERARLFEAERLARQAAEHAAVRMARLQELTAACSEALTPAEVAQAILTHGRGALTATLGVVALVDATGLRLEVSGSQGVSPEVVGRIRRLALTSPHPLTEVVRRREALWLGRPSETRALFPGFVEQHRGGEQAWAALPLSHGGRVSGSVLLGFETPRAFTQSERKYAETLAHHAAQALERIRLTTERARLAELAAGRGEFLASASTSFAASLDVETTLNRLVQVAVPALADFCVLDAVVDGDGTLRRRVNHLHSAKQSLLDEQAQLWGSQPTQAFGIATAFRTESPSFLTEITEAKRGEWARGAREASLLEVLGPRSVVTVPVRVRGRLLGVLACVYADSARLHTREDLALAEELAQRAGLALDNGLLYREAQQAIRLREEFVSLAAHELRTPLTALKLTLSAVQRDRLESGERDEDALQLRMDRAERHVQRLSRLVEDLLDASVMEHAPVTLKREQVDLGELVQSVVERHEEALAKANCRVSFQAPVPLVGPLDRERIDQVVTHLLANAMRYAAGCPIEIRLDALGHGAAPLGARLVVQDHGTGIAEEDQERVFDRFERAHPSKHYGGLGMGLFLVRRVLEAHGGQIRLDSRPGGGTTFTAELPFDVSSAGKNRG